MSIDEILQDLTDKDLFCALAKENYHFYAEYVHKGIFRETRVSQLLAEKLEAVERGDIQRLIVTMPPRHGKSMTITETFPSWFLGRSPNKRVIISGYGDSLAQRFGRYNRRKIEEFGEDIFDIKVSRDNSSVTNWGLEGHRGGILSSGIGGTITGEGADLLIIDDPIKNRQEANSITYREKVWQEWQNTLLTRLTSTGRVIIIMTRWHEDDLVGRLLKQESGKWEVINLPALAESENDLLGRQIGEALCPELGFDEAWAAEKKKEVGSQTWAALYQQRPSPQEGGILKRGWWKFYKQPPGDFHEIIQSWDMAFKDTQKSDYVVGQVWGRVGANKYLLDQVRGRMDFVTTLNAVRSLSAKWPEARKKLIEEKANGAAVIATLKNEISGLIPRNPTDSKEARAVAVSPEIEAGNVYLPDPSIASWVHDFIEECAAFPNSTHDDQVDAMTQALNEFSSNKGKWGAVHGIN